MFYDVGSHICTAAAVITEVINALADRDGRGNKRASPAHVLNFYRVNWLWRCGGEVKIAVATAVNTANCLVYRPLKPRK